MATAPYLEERVKHKPKRQPKLKLVDAKGRPWADSPLNVPSAHYHARRLERRMERARERLKHSPERQSVAIAMLAVEEQIVKALWTIARQPLGKDAPRTPTKCGIPYIHDRLDVHSIYADAAGGKYESVQPRSGLPSAKDISHGDRVQDWLLLVGDEHLARILVAGATSKKGDAGRQVNWARVAHAAPELRDIPARSLNFRYQEALRIIVVELTAGRVG